MAYFRGFLYICSMLRLLDIAVQYSYNDIITFRRCAMEPLFELRYSKDPHNTEYTEEIYRRLLFNVPFIAIVVFTSFTFIVSVTAQGVTKTDVFLLCAIVFLIAVRVSNYFRIIKLSQKRYIELYGDVVNDITITVTEDVIRFCSSVTEDIELKFSNVKKVFRTKHLVVFRSDAKIMYNLRLDSFTKGTPEEFILFLNSKGFKVKR